MNRMNWMNVCQVLILFGANDVKRKDKNDPDCKTITVMPG